MVLAGEKMDTEIATDELVLELGMPLLGRSGLNESALLKLIGDDRWRTLARIGGTAASQIHDAFDNRLYATFCFVELALTPDKPLSAYDEDDCLRFSRSELSHYSCVYLDGKYALQNGGPFEIRCTNVFIYQLAGPQQLKMAQPENVDMASISELPFQPDSLNLCRAARDTGTFLAGDASDLDLGSCEITYSLDPDRDANGAGLIYFANFVCFLDRAERALLSARKMPDHLVDARSTYWRRIGYFGNAAVTDQLQILVRASATVWCDRFLLLAFDYRCNRRSDGKMILVSSSRKSVELDDAGRDWIANLKTESRGTNHG
jgi:probable biosynthetic protein (TIGR04098 family)